MTIILHGIRFSMIEDGIKGPKEHTLLKILRNINIIKLNDIVLWMMKNIVKGLRS